jgi:Recombinase
MGKRHKEAPSRKRGGNGALANKRGADLHAKSLDLTIRQLRAAGHTTVRAISAELTRRKVPTARGGNWHPTTVQRLLARLL